MASASDFMNQIIDLFHRRRFGIVGLSDPVGYGSRKLFQMQCVAFYPGNKPILCLELMTRGIRLTDNPIYRFRPGLSQVGPSPPKYPLNCPPEMSPVFAYNLHNTTPYPAIATKGRYVSSHSLTVSRSVLGAGRPGVCMIARNGV